MNRGTAVIIRPSLEVLEAARVAIIKAVCRAAEYDEAEALASTGGDKYADVRYLVVVALRSRKAKVRDAIKVGRIGGHAYFVRKKNPEVSRRRSSFHADKDPRVIRAALDAAALTIPKCPKRNTVEAARDALAAEAAREGITIADAATRCTRAAIRARRRAILALREKPLPWTSIAEAMGLHRRTCILAYFAAKHERSQAAKAMAC